MRNRDILIRAFPSVSVVACRVAAAAMVANVASYVADGSPTAEEPQMANVVVSTTVAQTYVMNLSVSYVGALEPVQITGERPGADLYRRSGLIVI